MGCSVVRRPEVERRSVHPPDCGTRRSGTPAQTISYDAFRTDRSLEQLAGELVEHLDDTAYAYIVKTAVASDGALVQHGCGPNLEGGAVTLCTCKGRMRTWSKVRQGTWIAGFTSKKQSQSLFFLARTGRTFATHSQLWDALPREAALTKSMSRNFLGDVFEPHPERGDPRSLASYLPVTDHIHNEQSTAGYGPDGRTRRLERDLSYVTKRGRSASLLAFDVAQTWVWSRPIVRFDPAGTIGRSVRSSTLRELVGRLRE